jgi:hypothetical protein
MYAAVFVSVQSVRDAIIVTSCGAEALPFITAFGVLPASFLFFMYYDKLVRRCKPNQAGSMQQLYATTGYQHAVNTISFTWHTMYSQKFIVEVLLPATCKGHVHVACAAQSLQG